MTGGVALRRTAPVLRLNRHPLFRDHKKMVILDDYVAFTGGRRVGRQDFAWHDFMVRIEGHWLSSTWRPTSIHVERLDHEPRDGGGLG